MSRRTVGRLLAAFARLLHALRLYWIARWVANHLPPRMRLQLSRVQLRIGYMQGLTLVPEAQLEHAMKAALRHLGKDSADSRAMYLEFGVYIGTSLACMYRAATAVGARGLRIIGFDSFEGMPEGVEKEDGSHWHKGELFSDVSLTQENLTRLGVPLDRVELVPGWFEDSLTVETRERLGMKTADVVMIDCVIGSATTVALDFILPLIKERTIVFFDDWAILDLEQRGLGEKAAFEAWLIDHPEIEAEHLANISYTDAARTFLLKKSGSTPGPS
jgi:O-methyltransferase